MIESLEIEGYRGIAHGAISGLAPLTILVGPNSSGKSSVLEALALAAASGEVTLSGQIAQRRGWIGEATLVAWMPTGRMQLLVRHSDGASSALEYKRDGSLLVRSPNGNVDFRVDFGRHRDARWPLFLEVQPADIDPSHLDQAVSRADLLGARKELLELLGPLLPGIKDIRILQPSGRYSLFVEDDSPAPWPITVAGDGLKRVLLMAAEIAGAESRLVLAEEPESYLHVGALPQVAKVFWQAVSRVKPKQIVATTHSLELIDAIFRHPDADLSKAALFRMSLRKGALHAVRVSGESVRELRTEIGEDLRR